MINPETENKYNFIQKIKEAKKIFVWVNITSTRSDYIEVKKSDIIDSIYYGGDLGNIKYQKNESTIYIKSDSEIF